MSTKETLQDIAKNNAEAALYRMVDQFVNGIDTTIDFMKDQVPDVIMQLIMWNTAFYAFWLIIGFVTFVLTLKSIIRSWKHAKGGAEDSLLFDKRSHKVLPEIAFFGFVVCCFCVFGLIITIVNAFSLLKITLAPKLWLIEYAINLAEKISS